MAHRSGIGDYLDEDLPGDISDYAMTVPVHELATTEQFLAVLDGFPTKFPPGDRFSYCNGGFVVLALIAQRASGVGYHDLVRSRVCAPAGMDDTDFLRSDELPGGVALGYVPMEGTWRTNVFHLLVRATATVASTRRSPTCTGSGRRCPPGGSSRHNWSPSWSSDAATPPSTAPLRAGVLAEAVGPAVMLEGFDAGVSCMTNHDRARELTYRSLQDLGRHRSGERRFDSCGRLRIMDRRERRPRLAGVAGRAWPSLVRRTVRARRGSRASRVAPISVHC